MTELADVKPPAPLNEPFRPIHYLGSKARLLEPIEAAVHAVNVTDGPVVDLFSGSGVVSEALSQSWSVMAVDIQEYARVLASALCAPARLIDSQVDELLELAAEEEARRFEAFSPLVAVEELAMAELDRGESGLIAAIIEGGSIAAYERAPGSPRGPLGEALASVSAREDRLDSTVTRMYGGVYFSYRQAIALDSVLDVARSLDAPERRDTLLAAAFGAATATVTSIGSHFAQPMRPRDKDGRAKLSALRTAALRRRRDIYEIFADRLLRFAELRGSKHEVEALRGDYRSFLTAPPVRPGVVYADPPYTRDHYSRFYHVLETMALGDDPGLSEVSTGGASEPSRGLYREDRHQSPFCIRSQVEGAFHDLLGGVRALDASLVLSYSPYESGTTARPRPRLLRIDDLVRMASSYFARVEVRAPGLLKHSKFNAKALNGLALPEAESLIVCAP